MTLMTAQLLVALGGGDAYLWQRWHTLACGIAARSGTRYGTASRSDGR
jgi:hypothetical protein